MNKTIDTYQSPLGIVSLVVYCDVLELISETKHKKIFITKAHEIVLVLLEDSIKKLMSKTTFPIDGSKAWILYITKHSNKKEKLRFACSLKKKSKSVEYDVDCGEHLDAVCFENKKVVMNIGTEDGEVQKSRALAKDCMPSRLAKKLGYDFSITSIIDNKSLETMIPTLEKDEQIYFHYLIASKTKSFKPSDISTHLAVDFPKSVLLDNYIL